ncbi:MULTISPECIES: hypothetical protein [unclassified Acidiphilium]|uniref:hypothetical protein n=1 Tax=unclassified Acidiphilium TaxID=2617493 RepID=UPI000BC84704|nr:MULTISPECIES: hypothetical protein [unclassified Acidiphilium]OYV56592.1 MAG: hypothetical protein B7Z76_05210 [Acidiphilium sp. 20-67-58]HQT62023.1 hypothetical protein [Acidiphilium sp.]
MTSALVVLASLPASCAVALGAGGSAALAGNRAAVAAGNVSVVPYLKNRDLSPRSTINMAGIAMASHAATCRGVVTLLAAHAACGAAPRSGT